MSTKRQLAEVVIGGSARAPNPRDIRPDGSIILQCVGGPLHRKEMRVYPPHDDPIEYGDGYYLIAPSQRKNGKDVLVYNQE